MGRPTPCLKSCCVYSDTFFVVRAFFLHVGVFAGLGPRKTRYLSVFLLDGGAVRSKFVSVIRSGAEGPSGPVIPSTTWGPCAPTGEV